MTSGDVNAFVGIPLALISGIFFAYKLGIKAFLIGPILGAAVSQGIDHLFLRRNQQQPFSIAPGTYGGARVGNYGRSWREN